MTTLAHPAHDRARPTSACWGSTMVTQNIVVLKASELESLRGVLIASVGSAMQAMPIEGVCQIAGAVERARRRRQVLEQPQPPALRVHQAEPHRTLAVPRPPTA